MKRIPLKSDEWDAFTSSRRLYNWRRKQLKKIKRAYNKRFRKAAKQGEDK